MAEQFKTNSFVHGYHMYQCKLGSCSWKATSLWQYYSNGTQGSGSGKYFNSIMLMKIIF